MLGCGTLQIDNRTPRQNHFFPTSHTLHLDTSICVANMDCVSPPHFVLRALLDQLSAQDLKDIYGFVALDFPWVLIELCVHAMVLRSVGNSTFVPLFPADVWCIELFAGKHGSARVAKAFLELGCSAIAFDLERTMASMEKRKSACMSVNALSYVLAAKDRKAITCAKTAACSACLSQCSPYGVELYCTWGQCARRSRG